MPPEAESRYGEWPAGTAPPRGTGRLKRYNPTYNNGVTFKWKDYRDKGRTRQKVMTVAAHEFIRRFLIHVLPHGFHRIRHYGLFANARRAPNLMRMRELLGVAPQPAETDASDAANDNEPQLLDHPCPYCGGRMIVIDTFERGEQPRAPPPIRTGT